MPKVFGEIVFNADFTDQECEQKIYQALKNSERELVNIEDEFKGTLEVLKSNPVVWEACHDRGILDALLHSLIKENQAYSLYTSLYDPETLPLDFYRFMQMMDWARLFNIEHHNKDQQRQFSIKAYYNIVLKLNNFHHHYNSEEEIIADVSKAFPDWKKKDLAFCQKDPDLFKKYPLLMQVIYSEYLIALYIPQVLGERHLWRAKGADVEKMLQSFSESMKDHSFKYVWIALSRQLILNKQFLDKLWQAIVKNNDQHNLETLEFLLEITRAFYFNNPRFIQQTAIRVFSDIIQDENFQRSLNHDAKPLLQRLMNFIPAENVEVNNNDSRHAFEVVSEGMKTQGKCTDEQINLLNQLLDGIYLSQNSRDTAKVASHLSQLDKQRFTAALEKCLALCDRNENDNSRHFGQSALLVKFSNGRMQNSNARHVLNSEQSKEISSEQIIRQRSSTI